MFSVYSCHSSLSLIHAHTQMKQHKQVCLLTCTHAHTHGHTHTQQTATHAHTHTHTHTHTRSFSPYSVTNKLTGDPRSNARCEWGSRDRTNCCFKTSFCGGWPFSGENKSNSTQTNQLMDFFFAKRIFPQKFVPALQRPLTHHLSSVSINQKLSWK